MNSKRKIIALVFMALAIVAAAALAHWQVVTFAQVNSGISYITMIPFLVAFAVMIAMEAKGVPVGWVIPGLTTAIGASASMGSVMLGTMYASKASTMLVPGTGLFLLTIAAAMFLFVVVEFVVLRLLSLTRMGAIVRVTYYEALLQPFTLIVLGLGIACMAIFAFIPFFTQNEEAKMYRDVAASFTLIFTLPVMIFASSKVIDEEIENRTMLTLMSKPVARWQVVIGKYLGVLCVSLIVMTILGVVASACAYMRWFDDMRMDYFTTGAEGKAALDVGNVRAVMALIPSMVLKFFQVAILAAVAVAISTRWGLAFNITAIVLLFVLANLTQFVDSLDLPQPWQRTVVAVSNVVPHLNLYDLDQRLIYLDFATPSDLLMASAPGREGEDAAKALRGLPTWGRIWQYVGLASIYGLLYIGAALSAAVALFRTRELT